SGGHGAAGEGARDRRRGRGPAGDRNGASAWRRRHRLRRASRRARADRESRVELARPRRHRCGGGRRLRERVDAGRDAGAAVGPRRSNRRVRRRDHHRRGSRSRRASDHPGECCACDAARLRDRRSRRRDGRQLRAHGTRRDRRARGGDDCRPDESCEPDADARVDALLAECPGAAAASGARWRAQSRLVGRDHRRRMRGRTTGGSRLSHNTLLVFEVTILVLAIFVGIEVISKVPPLLHTPLMSGTNAIHGIVIVGAMLVLGLPDKGAFTWSGGFGAVVARRVKMTAMPQMVALFNGVGGGAAALVSLAELHRILPDPGTPKVDIGLAIVLSALIGSISFAGSMVAFAKLQELVSGRPITYPGQQFVNGALFVACLAAGLALVAGVQQEWLLWPLAAGAAGF